MEGTEPGGRSKSGREGARSRAHGMLAALPFWELLLQGGAEQKSRRQGGTWSEGSRSNWAGPGARQAPWGREGDCDCDCGRAAKGDVAAVCSPAWWWAVEQGNGRAGSCWRVVVAGGRSRAHKVKTAEAGRRRIECDAQASGRGGETGGLELSGAGGPGRRWYRKDRKKSNGRSLQVAAAEKRKSSGLGRWEQGAGGAGASSGDRGAAVAGARAQRRGGAEGMGRSESRRAGAVYHDAGREGGSRL